MEGKTPAVTVALMRAIFTERLRKRPPTAWEIAESVSRGLAAYRGGSQRPLALHNRDISTPKNQIMVRLSVAGEPEKWSVIIPPPNRTDDFLEFA